MIIIIVFCLWNTIPLKSILKQLNFLMLMWDYRWL
jgi:hypothetical protein